MSAKWTKDAALLAALVLPLTGFAADDTEGKQLFAQRCAMCHAAGGPGTLALSRRHGPQRALLEQRNDLATEYVRAVVRAGQLTMPPISRVEVTDAELTRIIDYLQR